MSDNKPASAIEALLTAANEDEQLQLCDELARGDKTSAEVDAALGPASPRIAHLRQLSAPLSAQQKDKLVALLLQPAPAQPVLAVVPGGAIARKPPPGRIRSLSVYAAGLAVAASVALYLGWPLVGEELPVLALAVTDHPTGVLGAPPPAGPAGLQVLPESCLELKLPPQHSYRAELQTAVWVVATGAGATQQPVPWPVQLNQAATGTLQMDACTRLPKEVGPGSWQVAVVYGRKLPPNDVVVKALTSPDALAATEKWHIVRQPLQVVAPSR